jgi:hypothetical protein
MFANIDTTGAILFSIIVLHLVAGIGYVLYKFSSSKKGNSATPKV